MTDCSMTVRLLDSIKHWVFQKLSNHYRSTFGWNVFANINMTNPSQQCRLRARKTSFIYLHMKANTCGFQWVVLWMTLYNYEFAMAAHEFCYSYSWISEVKRARPSWCNGPWLKYNQLCAEHIQKQFRSNSDSSNFQEAMTKQGLKKHLKGYVN